MPGTGLKQPKAYSKQPVLRSLNSKLLFFHLLWSRGLRRLESGGARGGVVVLASSLLQPGLLLATARASPVAAPLGADC